MEHGFEPQSLNTGMQMSCMTSFQKYQTPALTQALTDLEKAWQERRPAAVSFRTGTVTNLSMKE